MIIVIVAGSSRDCRNWVSSHPYGRIRRRTGRPFAVATRSSGSIRFGSCLKVVFLTPFCDVHSLPIFLEFKGLH